MHGDVGTAGKLVDIHRVSLVQVKHIKQVLEVSSDHHCHMASL